MATVTRLEQSEWERFAKIELPKSRGPKCPAWMTGDVMRPVKISRPRASVKVAGRDRKVYDRCAAAMMAGQLYSWSIDSKSGQFLVRVHEADDWQQMMCQEVAELLDGLGVTGSAPAAKVAAPVEVVEVVAPVAAEVRPIRSAKSSSKVDGDQVAAYLARLIHPPKRAYAAAMVAHLVSGGPAPKDPGTEWAEKVRAKLARLVPAGVEAMAVAS